MRSLFCLLFVAFAAYSAPTQAQVAPFNIEVDFSGSPEFEQAFLDAAEVWEGLLSGYQDGVVAVRTGGSSFEVGDTVNNLFITASIDTIDGAGGTLGQAGFTQRVIDEAGFSLSTDGIMQFDVADVGGFSDAALNAIVIHEMGHVMGFGTQWTFNNVYNNGSGEFTGANATAAWQSEFGQTGTPDVELGGGAGTANGHWNEVDFGAGLTGITDPLGRDMRDELMTGWANINANTFISEMTVASFVDIGFVAVPEPASAALIVLAGFAGLTRRRRS